MDNTNSNIQMSNVLDEIKDKKIHSFVEYQLKQIDSLQKLLKTESIKSQILQLVFTKNEIDDVVNSFLSHLYNLLPGKVRCVIFPNQDMVRLSSNLIFTFGEEGDEYNYLDEQIEKLLQMRRHLLISDTSKNRELKYFQDKPYPTSVAAFPIRPPDNPQMLGYLWIAFDQPCEFSREKIRPIFELIDILAIGLDFYLERREEKNKFEIFNTIAGSIDEPLMMFSNQYELIWYNQKAQKLFLGEQDELSLSGIGNEILLDIKENLKNNKSEFAIRTEIGTFEAIVLPTEYFESEKIHLLRFIDKTDSTENEALLSLILNIIRGNLSDSMHRMEGLLMLLTTQGKINAYQNDSIKGLNEEIARLNSSNNELLGVKRFKNIEKISFEKIRTMEVIDYALMILSPMAAQKKVTITKKVADYEISADRMLITQAVINLIENAIKYSHLEGEVKINDSLINNRWKLEIKDDGKGMSAIDLKQLLENTVSSETGMKGFQVVKEIVRLHGGKVVVESNIGEGTKASMDIPQNNK